MSEGPVFPPPPVPPPPPIPPYSGRSGPAWEGDGPFIQRYIDTVKGVLTDPKTFFASMRTSGGLGAPITFALVGMAIGAIGSAVWSTVGSFGGYGGFGRGGFVSTLVMSAVAGVAGLFIGSGIFHVMLSLLGAAKQPFEATLRVVSYVGGSIALLGIIPVCGSILGAIYSIYLHIIGLAVVHECDTTKSAIAVLVPAVVCCVLFMLMWGAVMALIFGAAAAGAAMQ